MGMSRDRQLMLKSLGLWACFIVNISVILSKVLQLYIMIEQNTYNQQTTQDTLSNSQIARSIQTINELMEKINQTIQENGSPPFQETLVTEMDEAELIQQLRLKLSRMKLPMHKLHIKNKLSTVIQESFSHSEQTSARIISPRDLFLDNNAIQLQTDYWHEQDPMRKKITGIRKASCSMKDTHSRYSPIRFSGESISNNRNASSQQLIVNREKEDRMNFKRKLIRVQKVSILPNESNQKSQSRGKKGLSVLSKKSSLHSEQSEPALSHSKKANNLTLTDLCSGEKQNVCEKMEIKGKKSIKPFVVGKKIPVASKQGRIRTCLSRTNIRDFYTSKRVKI